MLVIRQGGSTVNFLTSALYCWRRFEHVPQRFAARVTISRHVVVHGYELMPHVVNGIHPILKIIRKIVRNIKHKTFCDDLNVTNDIDNNVKRSNVRCVFFFSFTKCSQ